MRVVAAVAGAVAWVAAVVLVGVERLRWQQRRRSAVLLLHRLPYYERDGTWTWRVRGAKVPAARSTDVSVLIEPGACEQYCPDCLLSAIRWDARGGNRPRAVACGDCGSQFGIACMTAEPCEAMAARHAAG